MPDTIMAVSNQWRDRPADQRFLSLPALAARCRYERERSRRIQVSSRKLRVEPANANDANAIVIKGPQGTPTVPTHWSFGQLSSRVKAPAGYLRTLPAPVVADCLNYGLMTRDVEDMSVMITRHDDRTEFRACNGPEYGAIWNHDVVESVMGEVGDGVTGTWSILGEFGKKVTPTLQNTTIYGSDRDIFIALADETNRITLPNRRNGNAGTLARFFYLWNSEVGSQTIGMATGFMDYACMNRILWGVQEFREIKFRHTSGAPDRWREKILPVIHQLAKADPRPVEETFRAAQQATITKNVDEFLAQRFGLGMVDTLKEVHDREEHHPIATIWDAVTAATAYARQCQHQDDRIDLERQAGKLLDLVAVPVR